MSFIDKTIDFLSDAVSLFLKIVIVFSIALIIGLVGLDIHEKQKITMNQEEQMNEIYENQTYLIALLGQYQEVNYKFMKAIAEHAEAKLRKPSYAYLSNVTVYLFKPEVEDIIQDQSRVITVSKKELERGSVGTGTIVKEQYGYKYILTNKHVCNNEDEGSCFVILGKEKHQRINLEFVDQVEGDYDLALWRTKDDLGKKHAIKGLNKAYPQERIFTVGHYLGNPFIYGEGTFGGRQQESTILNMSCAPGCSGSGVFNSDGELVSVIYAGNKINPFQMDTAKVLAVNSDVIRLFLKDLMDD